MSPSLRGFRGGLFKLIKRPDDRRRKELVELLLGMECLSYTDQAEKLDTSGLFKAPVRAQ